MKLAEMIRERIFEGRKVLAPYLCAGFPGTEDTLDVMKALADSGADCMELGVPFSDPVADGPTIQEAAFRSLRNGMTLGKALRAVSRFRNRLAVPVILMSYVNPIAKMGAKEFTARCADAGVDALIVPDLPPEDAQDLGLEAGPPLIPLLAPNTPMQRMETLARSNPPLLYCVSVLGVTGARKNLAARASGYLNQVKKLVGDVPALAGFGVSTPDDARALSGHVDGIIVGSALLKALDERAISETPAKAARRFLAPFRKALDEDQRKQAG